MNRPYNRFPQIMRRPILIAVITALVVVTPFAQGGSAADETRATLRQYILELINRDRELHGLRPVELDIPTSEVADTYCRTQIANRTTGHFTTDGLSPYMRYSFGGGSDAVSENAAAWSADYRFNARALYEMARRSQQAMMAEKPPRDGHRRTILDPNATHVGIGLAWEDGEFRIAHEFVRRYVDWSAAIPREATTGTKVPVRGKVRKGHTVEAIAVHYEPVPETMPAHVASAFDSYALPPTRDDYRPRLTRAGTSAHPHEMIANAARRFPDTTLGDFTASRDGSFAFAVPFTRGAGIYTIVVWVRKDGGEAPFTASTISIRVDDAHFRGGATAGGTR